MLLDVMGLQYIIEQYNIVLFIVAVAVIVGIIVGIISLIIYLVNRHRLKKWLKNKDKKDKNREMNGFDTI